jgi:hypothetical protein
MPYQLLPKTTPDELEQSLLELWEQEDLFHRTMAANAGGKPFVFYEGPPTANGRPGIHHVFARTIKDLVNRYHAMLGESVTRIAGWDTHGLPVEIEVEKELNLSGKSDIERYGVAEFNRKSRESVFRYKSDWEALSNRIGYWLDYDRPYVTYENDYIESVWWLLQQLWSKDLLYEGHKVLPYCARCGTSLSSHELAMGYATHRSPSIYALFRLEDDAPDGTPRQSSSRPLRRPRVSRAPRVVSRWRRSQRSMSFQAGISSACGTDSSPMLWTSMRKRPSSSLRVSSSPTMRAPDSCTWLRRSGPTTTTRCAAKGSRSSIPLEKMAASSARHGMPSTG